MPKQASLNCNRFNTGLWIMQTPVGVPCSVLLTFSHLISMILIGYVCQVVSHRDCIEMGIGGKALVFVQQLGGMVNWNGSTLQTCQVFCWCFGSTQNIKEIVRYHIQNLVTKDSWIDRSVNHSLDSSSSHETVRFASSKRHGMGHPSLDLTSSEGCLPAVASKAGQHVPSLNIFFYINKKKYVNSSSTPTCEMSFTTWEDDLSSIKNQWTHWNWLHLRQVIFAVNNGYQHWC